MLLATSLVSACLLSGYDGIGLLGAGARAGDAGDASDAGDAGDRGGFGQLDGGGGGDGDGDGVSGGGGSGPGIVPPLMDAGIGADAGGLLDAAVMPIAGAPVASFVVDFAQSSLGAAWSSSVMGGGCTIGTPAGRVQFSMDGSPGRCELVSVDAYDLRQAAVSIHIPSISNYHPPMRVFFALLDGDDRIELAFHDNLFEGIATAAGAEVFFATSPYVPRPDYWRIRHVGSEVLLESSLDGAAWELEMTIPQPFDLARVQLSFGVEVLAQMPSSISIGVPGFNTVP